MADDFKYDVFLSHSSKDKDIVRAVAERLRADGLRVWFDEWELRAGDSIPAKIEEGLERSRVLVLCMSANAFGSDWTRLESYTFRFRDPLNKERRFIPLRLDGAEIKGSLAQFRYINWLPEAREQEYAKLLEACCPPPTQLENGQTVHEQDVDLLPPKPNIICVGDDDLFVELNRHEVFQESENTECALRAITARFQNMPKPPQKVGSINNVTARISYYNLYWPDRLDYEVQYGCWLNEETPYASFDLNTTHHLIIGVFEPNPMGGFKREIRVYGNSLDKNTSLSRFVYSNHSGFRIKVHLTVGEYGELSTEHDFELRVQTQGVTYSSFTFEHLTEEKKRERKEFLVCQLRQLIAEGEKFIIEPKDVNDWNQFCWDANTWRQKVEKLLCESMGTPYSIRFLDDGRLRPLHQIAREGENRFLAELRAQHENLKAIAVEYTLEERFAAPDIHHRALNLDRQSQIVLDNESKERTLVGEVISTVSLAGQICRELTVSDHGIDMEIEFKSDAGEATGRKLYLQLKSGDSYLKQRKRDGAEIFAIKDERHARYWMAQAFPVLLVVRNSEGEVRWMEVRDYLKRESDGGKKAVKQIVFAGERFDVMSVRRWRERVLSQGLP